MTRLAATEKGQYFPTPTEIAAACAAMLVPEKGATIYDPCAGAGLAVAQIADQAGLTAYGNELDAERAAQAATVLAQCTVGPFESVERTGAPFSAILFNPPYAAGATGTRLEIRALPHALAHLAVRGVLFAIVPLEIANDVQFLSRVLSVADIVTVGRFPGESFDRFKQVVLVAQRRAQGVAATENAVDVQRRLRLAYAAWQPTALPDFTVAFARTLRLEVPGRRTDVRLRNTMADPSALARVAAEKGATTTGAFKTLTAGNGLRGVGEFTPLLPLKRGHAAEMLAAGFLDGGEVTWEGKGYLVRGHARRIVTTREEEVSEHTTKVIRRERFATVVTLLDVATGEVTVLDMEQTRERYEEFLIAQADALTDMVQRRFPALYDPSKGDVREIAPAVGRALDLVRAPGALPGVGEAGLLPVQRNFAAACALALRAGEKAVVVSGEMGTGKTVCGAAVWAATEADAMHARGAPRAPRAVVMGPAHLAKKWAREAEKTLGAFGVRAFIARRVSEVDAAFASPVPSLVFLSREAAKMGAEWAHVGVCTYQRETRTEYVDGKSVDVRELAPVVRCPDCGAVVMEMAKDEDTGETYEVGPYRWDDEDGRRVPRFGKSRVACEACHAPLWQNVPYKTGRKGRHAVPTGAEPVFGRGLAFGGGRIALAEYISQRYAGRYTLLVDEVHGHKGASTDQGYAMMDLIAGAKKAVALTGTIYGGKASTLFHLGFRLFEHFRAQFPVDGEAAFVHAFGLVETTEYKSASGSESTSHYGYTRRSEIRKREIPGAQPEMIALLLGHSAFMELADLGVALPTYDELQVGVALPEAVADTVKAIEKFGEEAAKAARKGDTSLLSSYLQLSLGWPYRMEGAEEVVHNRTGDVAFATAGHAVPANGWALDQAFVRFCRAEKSKGRRVLGYLQQMIKRDASPRLCRLLDAAGLSTAVLRATVAPEEREAWVAAQVAAGVDVLLTNPQLVETGLDLIAFPTICHLGVDYSTYRLRQSSRRSWRLGQTEPVQVIWWFYQETEAHNAMPLLAKKLKAAQHVDGRLAEGLAASVSDEDGDLMSALIRQVMTGRIERGPAFPALEIPSDDDLLTLAPLAGRLAADAATPAATVNAVTEAAVPAPDASAWHRAPATQVSFADLLFAA